MTEAAERIQLAHPIALPDIPMLFIIETPYL